jgi:hypothetical protein
MMVKANFTFFIDRSAAHYHSRSILSGDYKKRNREPIMNRGFRRDEKGGSGGAFVE